MIQREPTLQHDYRVNPEDFLTGCYPAMILEPRVYGDTVPPGMMYAPANAVTYRVLVTTPEQQLVFTDVVPNHRRPFSGDIEIEFARAGDECEARSRGDQRFSFIIHEGNAPEFCTA